MNALLDVLTREGVLLKVSVSFWRGYKKLRPEDIGLEPDDVSDRLIRLGHKRLLPTEATAALALVESRAHAFVEANTFPFLNGLAHFLPNSKLAEVTGKLKELEDEFWQAKTQFLTDYAKLRESAMKEWRQSAAKLSAQPERLLAAIEASFPPALKPERTYGFGVDLFQIAVPDRLGLDLVALADQQEVMAAR